MRSRCFTRLHTSFATLLWLCTSIYVASVTLEELASPPDASEQSLNNTAVIAGKNADILINALQLGSATAPVRVVLDPGVFNLSAALHGSDCRVAGNSSIIVDGQNHAALEFGTSRILVPQGSSLTLRNVVLFDAMTFDAAPSPPSFVADFGASPSAFMALRVQRERIANISLDNTTLVMAPDCQMFNFTVSVFQARPPPGIYGTISEVPGGSAADLMSMVLVQHDDSAANESFSRIRNATIGCNAAWQQQLRDDLVRSSSPSVAVPVHTAVPDDNNGTVISSAQQQDSHSHAAAIAAGVAAAFIAVMAVMAAVVVRRRLQWRRAQRGAAHEADALAAAINGGGKLGSGGSKQGTSASSKPATSSGQLSAGQPLMSSTMSLSTAATTELQAAIASVARQIADTQLHIHTLIGRGAFGTVYRGTWRGLDVAVKMVNFSVCGGCDVMSDATARRVVNEVAIAYNLTHANIVSTYSYDIKPVFTTSVGGASSMQSGETITMAMDNGHATTDWRLVLIQEFCDGGTLRAALAKGVFKAQQDPNASFALITKVLREMAEGLAAVHAQDIIHGDLNPNNVLLKVKPLPTAIDSSSSSSSERVHAALHGMHFTTKLADFGLSFKMTEHQTHVSSAYQGTPFYVAPEVAKQRKITKAADMYAFGVMMWQLYHGVPPYITTDHGVVLNSQFPRFNKDCPVPYAVLASACMNRDYTQRPNVAHAIKVLNLLQNNHGNDGEQKTQHDHAAPATDAIAFPIVSHGGTDSDAMPMFHTARSAVRDIDDSDSS